jgi:hypothetical protein
MRSAAPGAATPLAAHVPGMRLDREAAPTLADRVDSPAPTDHSAHAAAVRLARVGSEGRARRSARVAVVRLADRAGLAGHAGLAGRRPEDSAAARREAAHSVVLDRAEAVEATSEAAVAVTLAAAATAAVIAKG